MMGRRGGFNDSSEPLLRDAALSNSEAQAANDEEVKKVRTHVGLLVFLGAMDTVVAMQAAAKSEDGVDLSQMSLTSNVVDVAWLVALRTLVVVLAAAQALVRDTPTSSLFVAYWVDFSMIVYAVGKLIAFDWSKDKDVRAYAGLFGWIAFGTAELIVTTNLLKWLEERTRWIEKEFDESSALESGGGVATSNGRKRIKQIPTKTKAESKFWTKSMLKVLKPYFWPKGLMNKVRCILTWVFLGLSKAANIVSPIFIGNAVQELSSSSIDKDKLNKVYMDIIVYSALVLASKVLKELQNMIYLKVKQTAYVEIAEQTFSHLHSLSLEWHLKKKMGNVLRSMDRGVDAANTLVTYLFLYLAPSIVECVIVFIIFYSHFNIPTVSATAFMSFMAYSVLTVQITLWRKKFREQTNKHDNDYHDKATDSLINYETVKYFTAEEYEIGRYRHSIYQYQKYSVNTAYSLSFLNSTQNLIIQLCTGIALCIAAAEVRNGKIQVGQFVSISAYIANLFAPLSFLGSVYNAVIQSIVDMTNLSELLQEEPDLTDAPNARPLIPVPSGSEGASIEFRNVFFHYPSQPPSSGLHGLSFKVEPGTTTAIVGSTGAGKSTCSRLLFRFYDPLSGKVLVSDQDIKFVTQKSLRSSIGVVPQDTVLFNDTILHNIAYGNFNATQEDIERACKSAQILDFIKSLPEGFETKVGERGLKLSGGEKQRVAIARCLLKNPPIVLLDEATSALDSVTERSVQAALNTLTVKRTTVVIAHRLTTIQDADQIIVLEKGKILEKGTHDELLSQKGAYHRLWNSRMEELRSGQLENGKVETDNSAEAAKQVAPAQHAHGHGHGHHHG